MRLSALFLVAILAAGCADPAPEEPVDPDRVLTDPEGYLSEHHCVKNDVRPRVYAPDDAGTPWVQGDYWTYELLHNGEGGVVEMAYYDDQDVYDGIAQHYMVGTETREQALEQAVFSTNPVVGRIHRILYSPHESGAHADMFNFPLCAGNTWNTKFFDTQFSMSVTSQMLDVAGQSDAGFSIRGTASDGSQIQYTYSPLAKWFTELSVTRADGLRVVMQLEAFGSGKSGEYYFLRGQQDTTFDLSVQDATFSFERENGGVGAYDSLGAYMSLARTSGGQEISAELVDPSGQVQASLTVPGSLLGGGPAEAAPILVEVPYTEGSWTLRINKPPVDVEIAGELRIASIYDRSGTV